MVSISEHINEALSQAITKGYNKGLKNVTSKSKGLIYKFYEKPELSEKLKVKYTLQDEKALRNFMTEAFTVAKVGEYELQEKLKALAKEVMTDPDKSIDWFKTQASIIADRYIRGDWLETNIVTGYASSYEAANWIRMNDPDITDLYPAVQYLTRKDSRVRDEHAALDGMYFRKNDPILKKIYPPNGWNCRCTVIPISRSEMPPSLIEPLARTEAETKEILKETFPDKKTMKQFARNSGETKSIWDKWLKEKLSDIPSGKLKEIQASVKQYQKTLYDGKQ